MGQLVLALRDGTSRGLRLIRIDLAAEHDGAFDGLDADLSALDPLIRGARDQGLEAADSWLFTFCSILSVVVLDAPYVGTARIATDTNALRILTQCIVLTLPAGETEMELTATLVVTDPPAQWT